MLVPLLILLATYALLSMGRLPRLGARRHRHWVALGGGLAMLATGSLNLAGAWDALHLDILALLLGMLALAAALEVAGFFDWLSRRVVERARTQRGLLVGTMVASAVLSALILNDAVVLLFTPVLVKAARLLRVDPMPYLAGEAFAANIGSVATPVGNPQNAYIAVASGLTFPQFALALAPLAALSLGAAVLVCLAVFRRSLAAPLDRSGLTALGPARMEPRLLAAGLATLAAVLLGFLLAHRAGLALAHVALAGGLAVLALAALLAPRRAPEVARRIDGSVLVFFVGLFWVIGGVQQAGLDARFGALFLGGGAPAVPALAAWAAVLSNVVSNVPAVLLIAPTVAAAGDPGLWLALAACSTLAGNATLVGAAANVIVAETARRHGAAFDVGRFMLAGVPLTLATLALAVAVLGR